MADSALDTPLRHAGRSTPTQAPPAPRKRRSAAVGALYKLAPSNLAKYMEAAAPETEAPKEAEPEEEHSSEEADDEEASEESSAKRQRSDSSSKPYEETKNDVIRRQRATIKRLEADVNILKREAIIDKKKIDTLNEAIIRQQAALSTAAPPKPPTGSIFSDKVIDAMLELLIANQLDILRRQERANKLEKNVTELHGRLYPMCVACQVSAGAIELDHPSHRVCLSCIDALSSGAKKDEKGNSYFPCPICKGKISSVNLSSFNIASAAGSRLESWTVDEETLTQSTWEELRREDQRDLRARVRACLREVKPEASPSEIMDQIEAIVDDVVTANAVRDHIEEAQ